MSAAIRGDIQMQTASHFDAGSAFSGVNGSGCGFLGALAASCLAVVPMVAPRWASAQTAVASPELTEIIVTAEKRSEALLNVPMSITAIGAATIERAGITDFMDYALKAPNVSFSYSDGMGISESRSISVRGIEGRGTTGFYIDDLPLLIGVDPHAIDMSRIEVLRGPQGTLYGARSMGGTIRLITKQPDVADFSATTHALASEMDAGGGSYQVDAGVNLPIAGVAGLRVGAFSSRTGGFENCEFPDPQSPGAFDTVHHVAREDQVGASASLLWNVSEDITIRPTAIYQRSSWNGLPLADIYPGNNIQRRLFNIAESNEDEWTIAGLTVSWHTSVGTLTSATSYFNRNSLEVEEASDWPAAVLGYSPPLPAAIPAREPQHEFVQEARFTSDLHGPVQFVAGLFYSRSVSALDDNWIINGLATVNGGVFGTNLAYFTNNPGYNRDEAAFGEATYSISSQWSTTLGLRYSKTSESYTRTSDGVFNGGPSYDSGSSSQTAITPKYVIKYQPDPDHNYYALASKGFRPGGPNGPLPGCDADLAALGLTPGDVKSYQTDSVWNYELGAKTRLMDRRLQVNSAVYWIEWTGIQQTEFLPCGFTFTGNAGKARSRGAELEISSSPLSGLTLSGGVGYTDAKITAAAATVTAKPGDPVQQVAPWTVSAAADYEFPLFGALKGFSRLDYSYVDHSYSTHIDPVNPRIRASYEIANIHLGVSQGQWNAGAFVQNATNARPNLADNESQAAELAGRPRILTSPPRTIGIEARMKF
jgi:iron complex outermembrane receptor protein